MAWTVGVNISGNLPDHETQTFGAYHEAFMALVGELVHTREHLYPDENRGADERLDEAINGACEHTRIFPQSEITVTYEGLIHWIAERRE